ncbi:hypothetical protein FRC96_05220 [Lujinxingia vulgaris]|uniref:Lipoprotein n=1 Tax=Lujinxingia vulgaris TaxID=2600176 RepID=A0A5C6XHF9_9DELT|nr:hypothetical protein [Lujinxingia vulgaris]TXD40844.1 hypothetical protein FRC96_05220 [Lujinxingia vulgaris]
MKTSLAILLIALPGLILVACAGAPTPENSPAAPTTERKGTVIQTEVRTSPPPSLPAGCTFTQNDAVSYILTCGPTLSFLARVETADVTPLMVEAQEDSVERTLQNTGWQVRRGERVEISADAGTLQLRHFRAERDDERINAFAGFAPSGPQRHRFFTCFLPDELVARWPTECAIRMRLLRDLANATHVTGVYLGGEPVELPEGCALMEKTIRCENNTFTWTEHPATMARQDLERRERDFLASFPRAEPLPLSCTFLGDPVECSSWRVDKEGYLPQLVLIAYATVGETTLQLSCEAAITEEASQRLPACEPFLTLTREE